MTTQELAEAEELVAELSKYTRDSHYFEIPGEDATLLYKYIKYLQDGNWHRDRGYHIS